MDIPKNSDPAPWASTRTIVVPYDIVAVKRTSPVPVKKRTPWRPQPDGSVQTERVGGREWFSDRLFVEGHDNHTRVGYGTSVAAHICLAIVVIMVVLTRIDRPLVRVGSSLAMPILMSVLPLPEVPAPAAPQPVRRSAPKATRNETPVPVPAPPPPAGGSVPTPVEAPSAITQETGREDDGHRDGPEGGVDEAVTGGVANGVVGGIPDSGSRGTVGSAGAPPAGPVRIGGSISPPRKIKDVKPVYPLGVFTQQAPGTVIIEATIGTDGKVTDTKVLRSAAGLDRAALDAVRQWEFVPTLLNGVPVAVILTVIVKFGIQ